MSIRWAWALAAFAITSIYGDRGDQGSSLRGALEALQRRQRGREHGPLVPQADYDALYEFVPPQTYPEPDYGFDVEDVNDELSPKYVVKLLDSEERPLEAYEYKVIKKKDFPLETPNYDFASKKESAFRERSQLSDNDRLRDLFMDNNDGEKKEKVENDAEYALLLSQLWSKYKQNNNKLHANNIDAPHGVVKLYKEKIVKKRYPDNWGPIAFKRKRSSNLNEDHTILKYEGNKNNGIESTDHNYNVYETSDSDKDNIREEYAIAFQPIDDDNLSDMVDEAQYSYAIEKRFPVTKRSSGQFYSKQQKRFAPDQIKREKSKTFRGGSGTDPKVLQELSKVFGESAPDLVKSLKKRSSDNNVSSHEITPPNLTVLIHNNTQQYNITEKEDDSHEQYGQKLHHPGIPGEIQENNNGHKYEHNHYYIYSNKHDHGFYHDHDNDHQHSHDNTQKPLTVKKKSVDWSDYFGIDKRLINSVSFVKDNDQERLKTEYFDTFNKEVVYPLNSFRKHSNVKRNFVQPKSNEESEIQIDRAKAIAIRNNEKGNTASENNSKLDNIDNKLRNMEGLIVDEALQFSNVGEKLDSKEEQEIKEKLLSRLAAAYSLEKMRKALKEFKQSLQSQKTINIKMKNDNEDIKTKRVAIKKEKAIPNNNEVLNYFNENDKHDDFEEEQGAGHYLNGKLEEQLSESYMGGSGRHRTPIISSVGTKGPCPVLSKIIQRCRGVDLLAGDRGQLFLPHCSLHQICYLCGEAPPTTCDLVFLSEADSSCEGDMSCQRAARSTLMALRELHDNLADELDGECEASPCLIATLKLNIGWQRALQR